MARTARTPTTQARAAVVLPADVRWMNVAANSAFVLLALALLAAALLWLVRSPVFALRAVQLDGDMQRNSASSLGANALPRLVGNFFTVDLQEGQKTFQTVPWVRKAVLHRVWPDRLRVQLEEHRAAALWQGPNDDVDADRLVNTFGEVFDANVGDVDGDQLPTLAGPDGSAPQMLALVQRLQPVLATYSMTIDRLHLSGRGSWRVELATGASIELGRGSDDEVLARTARFARTLGQVTGQWKQPLEAADLRHPDAYAVRLRNVATQTTPAPAGAAKPTGPSRGTVKTN